MDYKKKYRDANNKVAARFGTNVAKEIFTDLYESEDERIREEILEYIDKATGCKEWIAWLEKQGEPQSYKGNADTMRKNLIKAFKSVGSKHWDGFDVRDIIHFLESKDAIELEKQGEQNPAWSEEDEKMMQRIHKYVKALASNFDYEDIQIWFRNIKDRVQPHWKPTEQQMNALKQTSEDDYVRYNTILKLLYNDLKKL